MKRLNSKLKPIAFATLTALALSAPIAAQAEVSAGISLATMYLWRGQDVSDSAPEISGSLDYSHSSGFYAGMWTSSEAPGHSYEQDLYVGYAKSFGDFGIDLAIYEYLYPETKDDTGKRVPFYASDISEYMIKLSYTDLSLTTYINTSTQDENKNQYFSLDYSYQKFGFHAAFSHFNDSSNNYQDFNVSYALTDNASVTVSKAIGKADIQKNALVMFSYSIPLKL